MIGGKEITAALTALSCEERAVRQARQP